MLITKSVLLQAKVEAKVEKKTNTERTETSQAGGENEDNKEKEETANAPRRRPKRDN